MMKYRHQVLCAWFLLWDLVFTAGGWIGAYYIRFSSGWLPDASEVPEPFLCWRYLPLVILLAAVAYQFAGQYAIHRMRRLREEVVGVFKGTVFLLLLVLATTFYMHDPYESRATMSLFFVLAAGGVLTSRRLSWAALRFIRSRGYNQHPAVIVGTGRAARRTADALQVASWMGIHTIGFVEDQPSRWTSDLPILGTTTDLPEIVQRRGVGHVFIALPLNRYHEARRVFDVLSRTMAEVRLVVDAPNLAGLSLATLNLDGLPVISLRENPHFGFNVVVKRAMDIALSLLALVLLAPVMLVVAVLIKLTTPGPIFYCQERCGLNGRPFFMLKFRSMRADAEQQSGAIWARRDDPRRTRFGTFLRRTSLDELPQFINVLKGDMSLVGPRPERPVFIQRFSSTIPNYMARHCVKAGITGWAQVHGWRGNTSLRKRIQYDLHYITHWTPWLDLRILCMTLWSGLVHRNAY